MCQIFRYRQTQTRFATKGETLCVNEHRKVTDGGTGGQRLESLSFAQVLAPRALVAAAVCAPVHKEGHRHATGTAEVGLHPDVAGSDVTAVAD